MWTTMGVIKRDTRSLDYDLYGCVLISGRSWLYSGLIVMIACGQTELGTWRTYH